MPRIEPAHRFSPRWRSAIGAATASALALTALVLTGGAAAAAVGDADDLTTAADAPGETRLVAEDFSSGAMPDGWEALSGEWDVQDGRLVGTGAAYASDPARLVFGESVPDFRFEATVRFDAVENGNRWGGMILDHAADAPAPWQHALMRVNSAAVGFGKRAAGNTGWDGSDVLGSAPPADNPIALGEDIRMTVVVHGTRGEWWYQAGDMTEPELLAETNALSRTQGGTLGFVLDGATMSFDDIVVTDLNPVATSCRGYDAQVADAAAAGEVDEVVYSEGFDDSASFDCWASNGQWSVAGGELLATSDDAASPSVTRFGPQLTNFRFEATARVVDAAENGVLAFGVDLGRDDAPSALEVDAAALGIGRTAAVAIDVQGETATASLDGTAVGSAALPPRTGTGTPGISVENATVAFDDVRITKLGNPPLVCIEPDRVPAPGETGIVVAHRGNDGDDGIDDNLVPGYANSVVRGADAWESDIHITSDGVPVVRHDAFGDITFAEFQERFPGLPSLEEVLQFQQQSRSTHVLEYKGYWTQEEAAIVSELLREYDVWDDVIAQAFNLDTLDNIRAVDPELPRMWLTTSLTQGGDPVAVSETHDLLGINPTIHPTVSQVASMHAAGKKVFVWTQNSESSWRSLTRIGVDGIITDNTGQLVEWYAEYNAERGLVTCRDITLEEADGGTLASSADRQAEGETVTITAAPDEGHHTVSIATLPEGLAADEAADDRTGGAAAPAVASSMDAAADAAVTDVTFAMPRQQVWVSADFAPNTWTIVYDANGGAGEIATTTHTYDDGSTITSATPVRDGHAFAGWALSADADAEHHAPASEAMSLAAAHGASVTLYAVWTAQEPPVEPGPDADTPGAGAPGAGAPGADAPDGVTPGATDGAAEGAQESPRADSLSATGVEVTALALMATLLLLAGAAAVLIARRRAMR